MRPARLIAVLLACLPAGLLAHHDVAAAIKILDQKITAGPTSGPAASITADLHYERALEYRALRKSPEAEADLRQALKLNPTHREATLALVELLNNNPEALILAEAHLASAKTPDEDLKARFLLAETAERSGNDQLALEHCVLILQFHPNHASEVDLCYARLLLRSGRPAIAADTLKSAYQKRKSIVLRNTWIDAALSAGQTAEVLPIIEKELTSNRFRAAWLIRRARAHPGFATIQQDLNAALTELNSRIQPDRPDLTLIADRGLALALLGKKDLALQDLATLQKSTLSKSTYALLEAELK